MIDPKKPRNSLFEHLFLRYGAGSNVFKPITGWRHFNLASWIAIIIGIIGWAFFVWFLRTYFPGE